MDVFVITTASTGLDLLEIIKDKITIKGVIGLSDKKMEEKISDFSLVGKYCKKNNLCFIAVSSYNLKAQNDIDRLSKLDIDILIVGPWG